MPGEILHVTDADCHRLVIHETEKFVRVYDMVGVPGEPHVAAGQPGYPQPRIDHAGELHSAADYVVVGARAQSPGQRADQLRGVGRAGDLIGLCSQQASRGFAERIEDLGLCILIQVDGPLRADFPLPIHSGLNDHLGHRRDCSGVEIDVFLRYREISWAD